MIPFPKMHIATSVLNRVLNTLDGQSPLVTPMPAPRVPADPSALGVQIEEETTVPPAPIEMPPDNEPDAEAGMLDSSLTGGSPFDGALSGALGSG